jgi:tetratricopeptide (TPR) repeat protein
MSSRVCIADRRRPCCGQKLVRVLMVWMTLALMGWRLPATARSNPGPPPGPSEQRILLQARQSMASKKYSEAQHMLMQFISEKGEKVHYLVFLNLAEAHLKLRQYRQAVATLQQLLGRPEPRPRWWKLLAQVYMQASDYTQAAAAFKIYLELVKPSREEVMRLGDLYRLAGVPLKAARQYEKALQWPIAAGDYEKIATVYLSAHRPDKAVQVLNRAIDRKPSARLWHMLGTIQYNQGEYQQAHEAFRQSFELAQGDGSAALLMGYCALKLNKLDEAATAFESAARFSQQRRAAQKALKAIK